MKTLDNFKCPSDSHPKHRRRAGNGNGAFQTPPPFPDGVLPEEKLLETVLQCFAHPLVGLCELLQGAAAASPRTLSHGAALRRPQLPPPLAAVFSTLCLVAVCVCMHVMFSFATRMQLKVQLACGTACNILGKAFFFPLFPSLSVKLLNHIITCPMKVSWGKREKRLFGAMVTGSSPTTIAIRMMKENSSELKIKS